MYVIAKYIVIKYSTSTELSISNYVINQKFRGKN
jgi:hypothetical protein